jgi:DNA (cytosine-5)-methyltransferase 1
MINHEGARLMSKYKVLDLFAGGGGFSTGFQMARLDNHHFEIVKAVEIDEDACKTLENHLGKDRVIKGDITDYEVKKKIVSECRDVVDVIIGGPPCQTFSLAGPSRSGKAEMREALKNDPRNTLYKHFFELVEAIEPKFVVFENVEGITSKELEFENELNEKQRVAIEVICDELEALGYSTYLEEKIFDRYQVLNAADFGVPQQRKRVIIIGNLHGERNASPFNTSEKKQTTIKDAIGKLPVVLPEISTETNLLKFPYLFDHFERSIGKFIETINGMVQIYENHDEIKTKEFADIISFINENGCKLQKRKYKKEDALKEFIKEYTFKTKSFVNLFKDDYKTVHTSRIHNFRDVMIFCQMQPGSSSAQFIKSDSLVYNEYLDNLYPYDRTKHVDTYVKHSWNKQSNTILSHMQKDGLKFIHPDQPRTFTPYEAAMIQSFPPGYEFSGQRNAQYRQIGNAVPPLLAKSIGEAVLGMLVKLDNQQAESKRAKSAV